MEGGRDESGFSPLLNFRSGVYRGGALTNRHGECCICGEMKERRARRESVEKGKSQESENPFPSVCRRCVPRHHCSFFLRLLRDLLLLAVQFEPPPSISAFLALLLSSLSPCIVSRRLCSFVTSIASHLSARLQHSARSSGRGTLTISFDSSPSCQRSSRHILQAVT